MDRQWKHSKRQWKHSGNTVKRQPERQPERQRNSSGHGSVHLAAVERQFKESDTAVERHGKGGGKAGRKGAEQQREKAAEKGNGEAASVHLAVVWPSDAEVDRAAHVMIPRGDVERVPAVRRIS